MTENSAKTVFEQVALRQMQNKKSFKYKNAVIMLSVLAVAVLLAFLGHYLSIYRKNAPTTLCDAIISAYEKNEADPFLEYCTNLPKGLKNPDKLKEYFEKYLPDSPIVYYGVAADKEVEQKFIFKADGKKIAEIIFRQSSDGDMYGIKSYYVKSFELEPLITYRINAYSSFDIKVNSQPIDERYLYSKTNVSNIFYEFYENAVTQNLYVIDDFNYISEISACDYDGTPCEISYNKETSHYYITRSCEDIQETAESFCKAFTDEYLKYTLLERKKSDKLLSFIYPDSSLYGEMKNYSVKREYTSGKTESFTLKDIECFGNGYYACEISAVFNAENDSEAMAVNVSKTLYLVKRSDKFYLLDIN